MYEPRFDFLSTFLAVSIIQGVLQGFLLIFVGRKRRSESFISGIIVLIVSFMGIHFLLCSTNLIYIIPHFSGAVFPLLFLLGPLLLGLGNNGFKTNLNFKLLVHLIPFLITIVYMFPFFLSSSESKISYMLNYQSGQNSVSGQILFWCGILHLTVYLCLSIGLILKQKKSGIVRQRSLIVIFYILLFIILTEIVVNLLSYRFNISASVMDNLDLVFISLLLYSLGFRSYFNIRLEKKVPYKGKKIDVFEKESIAEALDTLLKTQFYLDSDITMEKLAIVSGYHRNQISQYVNQELGLKFKDWLNQFRLNYFKGQLLLRPYESILNLAYESGFNSKSTYTSLFKKYYNMPPGEYRKKYGNVKLDD